MAFYETSVATEHTGRRFYTYESNLSLKVGDLVVVPFVKHQQIAIIRGIVKKPTFKTKKIIQFSGKTLPHKSIKLLFWLENFYPYDFGEISKLFIPANLSISSRKLADEHINANQEMLPTKTKQQELAYKQLEKSETSLLHGITGSGKTRVFLELANDILTQNKSVLILTPEIGLTPQMVNTVTKHCPYPVKIIHSKKTPAQRKLVWEFVSNNKSPYIIIGPRSSLFLPFVNLGLVVVDESHDQSYKNMSSPRYNGLYVASKLASLHQAKFIQSTATPNVTEYIAYQQKCLPIVPITKVAAGKIDAVGQLVDLNDKNNFTRSNYISDQLIDSVNKSITDSQQSLIFLNRRGSARVVQCKNCGHIEECPNCGLPITFHHDKFSLICHICDYKTVAKSVCTECGSTELLFQSLGTKGIEQEINGLFPSARIARFDLDNPDKDALKHRYKEIIAGDIDIILGTQIISKGLDLPLLSTVGVLNADSSLQLPDYRAEEVAFQQLYQVIGRVGRGHVMGKFIIQTRNPEHPIIQAALKKDYQSFLKYESHKRKLFNYPPFSNIVLLKITKAKDTTAKNKAMQLSKQLNSTNNVQVLGPSPSYYHKSGGNYCWQIILKSSKRQYLLEALKDVSTEWTIDMDPLNLL